MTTAYITALDNDTVSVEATPQGSYNGRQVAVLDSSSCPLDRAGAVKVIESLTSAVAAHDRAEAERQAAKLKRNDKVRLRGTYGQYVVIRDEDEAGTVDLVAIGTGIIRDRVGARQYLRTQRAATRGIATPF